MKTIHLSLIYKVLEDHNYENIPQVKYHFPRLSKKFIPKMEYNVNGITKWWDECVEMELIETLTENIRNEIDKIVLSEFTNEID